MKFENIRVFNFEGALHGMRNPKESHHLSDSEFGIDEMCNNESDWDVAEDWALFMGIDPTDNYDDFDRIKEKASEWLISNGILKEGAQDTFEYAYIGPKDMKLIQTLVKGGSEHRKFLRQIMLTIDITAPLYLWKEFDTYKVGTTANSTSTMHKITSKPITLDCFEIDDYKGYELFLDENEVDKTADWEVKDIIDFCEKLRQKYLETKDVRYWKELIRWLPESWLQTRTVTMNYENVLNIIHQRDNHKLTEWHSFIDTLKKLPYANEVILGNKPPFID